MLEERIRPRKPPSVPASVDDADGFSSRAARIASRYGDVVYQTSGNSGRWTTFRGDSVVVRLAGDARGTTFDPSLFERVLVASSLPGGPAVLECDPAEGFLVERRFPGHVLDRVWMDMSNAARTRTAQDLAGFRSRLADVHVPAEEALSAGRRLAEHVHEVFGAPLAPWAAARLQGDLRWRHADLHAENLLVEPVSGELLAVVDWEWVTVSVEPVDQARLYAVAAYQVGMPWASAVAGPITPGALLAAFALQCVPRGYEKGTQEFYDSILDQAERFAVEDVE